MQAHNAALISTKAGFTPAPDAIATKGTAIIGIKEEATGMINNAAKIKIAVKANNNGVETFKVGKAFASAEETPFVIIASLIDKTVPTRKNASQLFSFKKVSIFKIRMPGKNKTQQPMIATTITLIALTQLDKIQSTNIIIINHTTFISGFSILSGTSN